MKVIHSARSRSALLKLALLITPLLPGPELAWASLPPGWSDADIGSPTLAGSASDSNGLWTVTGGGADIWNDADQFNLASTNFTGDGTLTVQVTSLQNSDPGSGWSKAGLMFRNDSTAGSANVAIVATAGQGVSFQWRSATDGASANVAEGGGTAPVWLRLTRLDQDFTGYFSTDGSNWVEVGSAAALMNGTALAGLAVTAHNDSALNTATFTNFSAVSTPPPIFGVYRERWTNLNANIGNTLAMLTNTTYNPDWPAQPAPAYTEVFPGFETEVNDGLDYYGQRLRAFVVPPTNGNYTFWIASDDTSILCLSTNENPTAELTIAAVTAWTSWRDFTAETSQQSAPVYLQGGRRYFLEALHEQGTGGDNLTVQWELPNGTTELPLATGSAAGTLLIPFTGLTNRPGIYVEPPTNTTVVENSGAAISLLVTNQANVSYQWQLNGTNLPGANSPVLTFSNLGLSWSGAIFSCRVTNAAGAVTSTPTLLTVRPDTNPPTILQVENLSHTNVQLAYSKVVEAASATNTANYVFTNGLAVTGAVLAGDNQTVVLTTAPMTYGSNYCLVVNGVRDRAATPNVIATNTTATFQALPFVPLDLGHPPAASVVTTTANGFDVTAVGAAFGGEADQGNFSYELVTGDFDVAVRVSGLRVSDTFAQAGLMARETLTASARFAAVFATPAMNGSFFEWRDPADSAASTAGSFPANYPNTWLRLQRVGDAFNAYAGYDGQAWTLLGSEAISMPEQIYLGYAVSSHDTNEATTAKFSELIEVTNAIVGQQINPHDAIGPSSRMTPVVFSEIMWKPAPRTDGKNLEFLELYNSNPWFQDISGYRITCADLNYTFPANTQIPGGGYLVVAAAPADITSIYGVTNVLGPYTGSLKHSETLQLLDEETNVLLTVPYDDVFPWPVATDGTGHSLVLANPTYGAGDPRAWDISDTVGGSPGQMDGFSPSPLRNVVINELLPHSESPAVPQFIELYNHSTNSVDISGCILTDDPTTNKFVISSATVIGPAGFVSFTQSQFGFTLNGAGETLYFIKPDGSRVLDAVKFGAQPDGVSYGRWPDGANDFYNFATNTPGTNNSRIAIGDIAINELMYDPISGNNEDQYIELYNQGTNTVNLAGWQFTSGVTFTFPSITIAPNGYLVVAKSLTNLFAKYTNLNTANTVGNYSGKLSHDGAQVTLSRPATFYTNSILVAEDQVAYGAGGRWGEWSSGGGSSLELIDPHSNHRLASNWADSDETQKSVWTDIETTGVLDNGANYDSSIDYAQIGLLDSGECLLDNLEVDYNGVNYVSNGTFEGSLGLTDWSLQGCMSRSSLESSGYQSSHSLHLRSSDRFWTGNNSCEVALNNNPLASGLTATLRFKARWLRGWPEVLLRLSGNWLEATAAMPVPTNLGSPGLPNSARVTNAGPAIYNVTHNPPVPAANQAVVVTANVCDPNGVQNLTLFYRLDPATNYTAVPMRDNGTGGDAVPGDGIFSATIPGQAANQVVAFYLAATDSLGTATRFPALRPQNNEPARECVVMFGDGNPGGSFGVYHLWLTQTNINRWANLGDLSNEGIDGTFVNGKRVIYNMQGHFAGSPYHQSFDTPNGSPCNYELKFNDDDLFLGTTYFNQLHDPGAAPGQDASIQRSELAFTFQRAVGTPWIYQRYIALYVNGNRRDQLLHDRQNPGTDVVKEHFPNDSDGFLFKLRAWFEFAPFLSGQSLNFDNQSWCTLMPYTTTGGIKKTARYRYMYDTRRTPDSESDLTNVFSLVDAAGSYGTANYVANLENMANMEEWMRTFAADHAAGDWDTFGAVNSWNTYTYVGTLGTKFTMMVYDYETVLGDNGSWDPGVGLLSVNSSDSNMQQIYNNPTFLRMYWRALGELVNGPLNVANSAPLLLAKYNAFTENGLTVENPTENLEPWLSAAQTSIAAQLTSVNATSFTVNPTVTVTNNVAYLTGVAPINVATIWINGAAYPLTWTTLTTWQATVPLQTGTNRLTVTGIAHDGQAISGDTGSVSVVYSPTNASPAGRVVINEIMYAPLVANAEFVELYNNSSNTSFDLSGWQLPALDYTFPDGSILAPTNYLVLAANGTAFAAAYGATNPVFDVFSGTLPPAGELLTLATASNNTVAQVEYASQPPWPTNANGTGSSLQLIDPHQDNWRVGNWSTSPWSATPDAVNRVAATLTPFPSLWINELQPENLTGLTNSAGQHSSWVELFNPGAQIVSLNGLYLANNYTNLLQWAFPSNAEIGAGQFAIVFTDGETNLSTASEAHASFLLSAATGSVALTRLAGVGQQQVLDFVDYTNVTSNDSFGSYPDGQSFLRQEFYLATPGASNNASAVPSPSFVDYAVPGSVYAQDFDSLPDPGATSVDANNPVTIDGLTYSLANPYDFAFPVAGSGSTGGLGLSALAGWYGASVSAAHFGASYGDQTKGGQISFGPTNSSNRALGLLATSTTAGTTFGVRLLNGTGQTLNFMNLQYTGEVWRQSNLPKTLQFFYFLDQTGTNTFPTGTNAFIPALNVNFPIVAADTGGVAVDGTLSLNQTNLSVTNQAIAGWAPETALWLMWQMSDSTGKAQGLAIDNLTFSASTLPAGFVTPAVTSAMPSGTNFNLPCPTVNGLSYQLECSSNLASANWLPLGAPIIGTGNPAIFSLSVTNSQLFFRVQIRP